MITASGVAEVRSACDEARRAGRRVGFVPTMGFLHPGHRSLMRAARVGNDVVVASIFVNPLQFGPTEDLERYPRDLAGDSAAAEAEGVDLLFLPAVDEMYPEPPLTTVHVAGLSEVLCGASRPGHFDGVATVVAKLLSIVGPCTAYFGRKDAQQLAVVRRMVSDLHLPADVVGCPLVRERDGVAMSSRNAYLSEEDRRAAPVLFGALRAAAAAVTGGERSGGALRRLIAREVAREPRVLLEYVATCRPDDLEPLDHLEGDVLVAVAARVGSARLIDNITLCIRDADVVADLGVVTDRPESEVLCAER